MTASFTDPAAGPLTAPEDAGPESNAPIASASARRNPARTRARLLDAAVLEFSEHGFSGARTDRIASRAGTNIRMLYHYFGSKDELYVCVLEEVLAHLRHDELKLDAQRADPLQGLLQVFDYVEQHFGRHPELRQLLAFENLNEAKHLRRSERIAQMASPVLQLLQTLLQRGEASRAIRPGIDALHLYVSMVSLAYYGRAHVFTLSRIFAADLQAPGWQRAHIEQARLMFASFLIAPR
jgi:AcrR family transcriptional regulator